MKKTILFLILLLIIVTSVSADSLILDTFISLGKGIKKMDTRGVSFRGLENKLSEYDITTMNKQERLDTYNMLKQKSFGPSMLSLGLGFGSGSRMVGDVLGHYVGVLADPISLVGSLTGLFLGALANEYSTQDSGSSDLISTVVLVSVGVFVVSRIIQVVSVPIHVARYNAKLRESLGLTKADIKMALVPNENLGLTAVAAIQF